MKEELCPRCKSVHWIKKGEPYLDRYEVRSQLWECEDCHYTEERFAE
jgi:transposase-like protein